MLVLNKAGEISCRVIAKVDSQNGSAVNIYKDNSMAQEDRLGM